MLACGAVLVRLCAALGLALLVAGCHDSAGSGEPDPVEPPAGLRLSVLQYRSDYTERHMQVKVTNTGSDPLTVTAVRLSSTAFTGEGRWVSRDRADETVISPGTSTDLPIRLPASDCAAKVRVPSSTARLDLRRADGSLGRTPPLPFDDPYGSVQRVYVDDCRRATALDIADLTLADRLRTTTKDGRLTGLLDLHLTPSGGPGRLTVESIGSTTLLAPPSGVSWPIDRTISADQEKQTVTLELRPARCDPHAIAEDKLGTVLPLTVRVDDGESGVITIPADADLRNQIQRFVHAACAAS